MLHKLAVTFLPLALLMAACAGGASDGIVQSDQSQPAAAPTVEQAATVDDPAPVPTARALAPLGDTNNPAAGSAGEGLFGALNPFSLMGGFDAAPGLTPLSGDVDPSLKASLLLARDLPADYSSLGEFGFSLPTEFGPVEMAASQFGTGDASSNDMGSMVMSAAMKLPPEALDELGDLDQLTDLTEADLAELQDLEGSGVGFEDFHLLDASALGDGGAGFHMEINLGAFIGALFSGFDEEFGGIDANPAQADVPMPDGIAMDIYMFMHGDQMLMLMVMWPLGENPGVDARQLADTMDGKAHTTF